MNTIIGMLKQEINLCLQNRWLKSISKEIDKYEKYQNKADTHGYIAHKLKEEYDKIYGGNVDEN